LDALPVPLTATQLPQLALQLLLVPVHVLDALPVPATVIHSFEDHPSHVLAALPVETQP
jgi:hypothetical protein